MSGSTSTRRPASRESVRLITPRSDGLLLDACTGCGSHVCLDCGFVDMNGPPRKSYMCTRCARLTIGEAHAVALLAAEQQREFDLHGRHLVFQNGFEDVRKLRARIT